MDNCFYLNNAATTDPQWLKSVSRNLAIRCKDELYLMAKQYSLRNTDSDDVANEEGTLNSRYIFSESNIDELFEVMMVESLIASAGNKESEQIIVWKTTHSRKNRSIGKYCIVDCNAMDYRCSREINVDDDILMSEIRAKKNFIASNLRMKISNKYSQYTVKMNLDVFLTHLLIYKESASSFSLDNYTTNKMIHAMESDYFNDNALSTLITSQTLVKTAKKSLRGTKGSTVANIDGKMKRMIEIMSEYNFHLTDDADLNDVYASKGYDGLLNIFEKGLNLRLVNFVGKKIETYNR